MAAARGNAPPLCATPAAFGVVTSPFRALAVTVPADKKITSQIKKLKIRNFRI